MTARRLFFVGLLAIVARPVWAESAKVADGAPTALQDYVAKPDASYKWEIKSKPAEGKKKGVYNVQVTSQTWQGIDWVHTVNIFEPAELKFPNKCLLFNTGGRIGGAPNIAEQAMGMRLAQMTGARVIFLFQVPNQPLLGNKSEDDLITETFLRYLKTKDATWPLLFPMVKSVVRTMDAVQEIARKEWGTEIDGFLVSGASKRGWTSWLSAVADKRIYAIAPIVIDMLNTSKQMPYQIATWGEYSEQIQDYTRKGLVELLNNNPEIPLWKWVDPWTYRNQLSLPKLIINGTNDPYWVVDALNIYWDGLQGSKQILYVPNAGHGLEGGHDLALSTLSGYFARTASGKPMPAMNWRHEDAANGYRLKVSVNEDAVEGKLWSATSPTKDFRKAKWAAKPLSASGDGFVGEVEKPDQGHVALFGELRFKENGVTYSLSTQLRRE